MTNIFDKHLPPIAPAQDADGDSPSPRSNKRAIAGLSSMEQRRGTIKLNELSEEAFDTLRDAMRYAEFPVAVQAAKLVLDRSGFGPTTTLKVEDITEIEDLTTEELAAIAIKLANSVSLSTNNKSESKVSESKAVH